MTSLILKELTPLYRTNLKGASGSEIGDVISESLLSLSIDPVSGTVYVSENKKDSIKNIRDWYFLIFQIVTFLFIVVTLILTFLYFETIADTYNYYRDSYWLKDFYEKNAPEKLKNDPGIIRKLLLKNKKQMFLLWRKLEKTYSVKWSPPYSILESSSEL